MRRKDREIKNSDDINKILSEGKIIHIALNDDDFPYIVPLNYGYEYDGGKISFYFHSAKQGRKLELINKNPKAAFEIECGGEIALGGDTPCNYTTRYLSVAGKGTVFQMEDLSEKIKGMNLIMKNLTGREFSFTEEMLSNVSVFKLEAESFSAKGNIQT